MKWRVLLAGISILAGLSVIGIITYRTGSDLRTVALHLPPRTHFLALLVATMEVWARGLRFLLLARGMGIPVRAPMVFLSPLVGDAAGAATPSRVGTDAGKVACLLRGGMELGGAAAVLFGDLIFEALILVLGGIVVLAIAPEAWIAVLGATGYAAVTLLLGATGIFVARLPRGKEPPRLWYRLRLAARRWRQARVVGRRFIRRSRELRGLSPGFWLALLAASGLHFIGRLGVLPVVAWHVMLPGSLPALIGWPMGLIWVAGFLPPPSGGGGVEFGFVATLSSSLPPEAMAGTLFWWRFYSFYLSAIVGAVLGLLVFGRGVLMGIWSRKPTG